jgi:hypothetical protein
MIRALALVSLFVLAACGNPNLIDGKSYKSACAVPAAFYCRRPCR